MPPFNRSIRSLIAGLLFSTLVGQAQAQQAPQANLKPLLPPVVYAVQGKPLTIYLDNVVLTDGTETVTEFSGQCELGHQEGRTWTIDSKDAKPGVYPLTISVVTSMGKEYTSKTQVLLCASPKGKQTLRMLIMGDSLTNASYYPNRIAHLLNQEDQLDWSMIGTREHWNLKSGVKHEGYGGRAWPWFVRHYEPEPDPKNKPTSPFVFPQPNGEPKLDLALYLDKQADGERPDLITILLGINDCFTASRDPEKYTEEKLRWMFENADVLVAEFRKVCPDAKIGICITPPSNSREGDFVKNYLDKYPCQGWQVVLRDLQTALIEHFKEKEAENVFLIPIELHLDAISGFPEDNAVHPNEQGYNQIGDAIYAWMIAMRS